MKRTLDALKSAGQLAIAALIALTAVAIAGTALMHIVDPLRFGLWSGPHMFSFGVLDDAGSHAHQLSPTLLDMLALVAVLVAVPVCRELIGYARARPHGAVASR